MTVPPPGGADGTDGSAHVAGPSAALHPLLDYDPDRVIARANFNDDMRYVIGDPGANRRDGAINTFGDLVFSHGTGGNMRRYCFRFRTDTPGYVITPTELIAAIRGDIDSVSAEVTRAPGDELHDRRTNTMAYVELPRPSATPHQRGWATRRFNQWCTEREEADQRARERERIRKERLSAVDARAWKTLNRYLTEEQRRCLDENDWFLITGSKGTKFRVYGARYNSPSGNVWWLDEKEQKAGQLCAHCDTWSSGMPRSLPLADHILTQVLEIVTDEEGWMKIAHHLHGAIHPLHQAKYALARPW